ncbi:MAG: DUF2971 domain-containing protein [Fibrobacter sp.]|nr:DUF2971 domain-containing protein [Fibrobacter sp.]
MKRTYDYYDAVLRKTVQKYFAKDKLPETLYQYSSSDTFKAVLNSKVIWATHWNCLNDKKELRYGFKLLKNSIEYIKTHATEPLSAYVYQFLNFISVDDKILNNFDNALICQSDLLSKIHLFMISFTEKPDSLSQWRGYGNGYNSISMGFSTKELLTNRHPNYKENCTYLLMRVIYDEREQFALITYYLGLICKTINETLSTCPSGNIFKDYPEETANLLTYLIIILLCVKEKGWYEECEWRIISYPAAFNAILHKMEGQDLPIKTRKKKEKDIRYIELPVFLNSVFKCISEVYLPQGDNLNLRMDTIKQQWESAQANSFVEPLDIKISSISIEY